MGTPSTGPALSPHIHPPTSPSSPPPSGPADFPAAQDPFPGPGSPSKADAGSLPASLDYCVSKMSSSFQVLALWSLLGSKVPTRALPVLGPQRPHQETDSVQGQPCHLSGTSKDWGEGLPLTDYGFLLGAVLKGLRARSIREGRLGSQAPPQEEDSLSQPGAPIC